MGSCWEVRGNIIFFYQTGPKYLHVPPSASFFSLWVLLSHFSILHGDLRGSNQLTPGLWIDCFCALILFIAQSALVKLRYQKRGVALGRIFTLTGLVKYKCRHRWRWTFFLKCNGLHSCCLISHHPVQLTGQSHSWWNWICQVALHKQVFKGLLICSARTLQADQICRADTVSDLKCRCDGYALFEGVTLSDPATGGRDEGAEINDVDT